jgi:hypothetical protein
MLEDLTQDLDQDTLDLIEIGAAELGLDREEFLRQAIEAHLQRKAASEG